jgi:hypothetical protein
MCQSVDEMLFCLSFIKGNLSLIRHPKRNEQLKLILRNKYYRIKFLIWKQICKGLINKFALILFLIFCLFEVLFAKLNVILLFHLINLVLLRIHSWEESENCFFYHKNQIFVHLLECFTKLILQILIFNLNSSKQFAS